MRIEVACPVCARHLWRSFDHRRQRIECECGAGLLLLRGTHGQFYAIFLGDGL
jgi:hypothetical protein